MNITAVMTAKGFPKNPEMQKWFMQAIASMNCMDAEIIHVNDPAGLEDYFEHLTLSQEPLGVNDGFNFAAANVKTEWLSLIGSDDFYDVKNASTVINHGVLRTDADVIYFPYEIIYPEENNRTWVYDPPRESTPERHIHNCFVSAAGFVRKSMWDRLGGYKDIPHADWDFWARAHAAGAQFKYIPTVLYHQRFYSYSSTRLLNYSEAWARDEVKKIFLEALK